MTSSAPKWKERGKLPSGAMREQDQYQGSPERQYRPQSNAPATFPARIRPSVSSEFNLSFSISAEKLRTRYLPSAIEVSERGSDSAYYVHEKKTTKTGKAALTTNDLDDTISKTDTGSFVPVSGRYGFKLPRHTPMARRTQPVFGVPFGSST